jgi:hypothetical protein
MTKKRKRISVKMPSKDPDFRNYGITDPELAHFLKSFEDWALEILVEGKSKYGVGLSDLWRMIQENDSRIDKRTRPAASLLISALHLRDSIVAKKAEQAAISMLELVSCVISIYIEAKNESSSKGGKASKKKEGIRLAIKEALDKSKVKTAKGLWKYFEINHGGEKHALKVGDYNVWFYKNPTGSGKDLLYQDDGGKESTVTFVTFKKYVMEVKKSLTNHFKGLRDIL